MSLKALLLCSDEKIVRVLRRTLGDLEIEIEVCSDAERALRKLTRHRFEAIIVDCTDRGAEDVLRSARKALCNRRAVAVAILDQGMGLRSVFDLGAHFVLYKPFSGERAKSSFCRPNSSVFHSDERPKQARMYSERGNFERA